MAELPVIPEYITVHLGRPASNAKNVTVSFPDYIKNVASSEIYPTWDDAAIRANVYAQISLALNRVYTEYYRSQGYDFNITSSTSIDQAYINGRDIFENISRIVDGIFNSYIRKDNRIEPLFASYCDGTTVTCDGMSQWGSQSLAKQGKYAFDILQYYYGDDINLERNVSVEGITASIPTSLLRVGSTGNDVLRVQIRLNRISSNFPDIPKIAVTNGIFGKSTLDAVLAFQRIFNLIEDGIVGKVTWYKIQFIYNGIKRLSELNSEGLSLEDVSKQFPNDIKEGDSGNFVRVVQYYLAYVAQFINSIPDLAIDGYFGERSVQATKDFQDAYALAVTGIVDEITYTTLYDVYLSIINTIPPDDFEGGAVPFPGQILSLGDEGTNVLLLQEYLNFVAQYYDEIPGVDITGVFSSQTRNAVLAFQSVFGLEITGDVGPVTWNELARAYDEIKFGELTADMQYPGFVIGGGNV